MAEIVKADDAFDHGFFEGTSCAFGVFDGVHRGHRFLLDRARDTAARSGGRPAALSLADRSVTGPLAPGALSRTAASCLSVVSRM